VPLIVKPPAASSLPRGKRISPMVGHADLMPTILEIASLPKPEGMDGVSLAPLMKGESNSAHDTLLLHGGSCKEDGVWTCPEVAVTDERWKLLRRRRVRIDPSHNPLDYVCLAAPADKEQRRRRMGRAEYFNTLPLVELYDLESDPYETTDLSTQNPTQVERLGRILSDYLARNPRRWGG